MTRTPTRFSLEISDEITAEALIGDGITLSIIFRSSSINSSSRMYLFLQLRSRARLHS
ncbi:MAG: hypothetical protein Q8Q18_03585 [bacterium]|nr:hypothetical protein [bacterium]